MNSILSLGTKRICELTPFQSKGIILNECSKVSSTLTRIQEPLVKYLAVTLFPFILNLYKEETPHISMRRLSNDTLVGVVTYIYTKEMVGFEPTIER